MNCVKAVILLSSFFASVRIAEQASFNINYLRRLTKRQVEGQSSTPPSGSLSSPSPPENARRLSRKSLILRERCEKRPYRQKVRVRYGCEAHITTQMCTGQCPSRAVPDIETRKLTTDCTCCRAAGEEVVAFKVDCNTNYKRVTRYREEGLRRNQYVVWVPEAKSCSCRPSRCALLNWTLNKN